MSMLHKAMTAHLGAAHLGPVEVHDGRVVATVHLGADAMRFDDRDDLLRLVLASRQALFAYDDAARLCNVGLPLQPRPFVEHGLPTAAMPAPTARPKRQPGAHAAPPMPRLANPKDIPHPPLRGPRPPVAGPAAEAVLPTLPPGSVLMARRRRPQPDSSRAGRRRTPLRVLWLRLQQRWRATRNQTSQYLPIGM